MHSTDWQTIDEFDGQVSVTFHHNGDYSGEVITQVAWKDHPEWSGEVRVPFAALKELVGNHLMSLAIARLEGMSGVEFANELGRVTR